jgi:hypothetical protein
MMIQCCGILSSLECCQMCKDCRLKAAVMEMEAELVSRTTCKHLVLAASVSAGMGAVLPSAAADGWMVDGRFHEQPYERSHQSLYMYSR